MRNVRPRKLAQLALIGARALPENNEGVRRLAPALMRQPNDRHLLHCGVSVTPLSKSNIDQIAYFAKYMPVTWATPPSSQPTLWRTCRVLANRKRLQILVV